MEINSIFRQQNSREDILSQLCEFLEKEYRIKAYFCHISGKRWAFMAGNKEVEIPRHRFMLDDDTGLVVERISHLDSETWNEILNKIKSNI